MRVFAIVNMKGGVAKTTTACNMAYMLAAAGRRVLLIETGTTQENGKRGVAALLDHRP